MRAQAITEVAFEQASSSAEVGGDFVRQTFFSTTTYSSCASIPNWNIATVTIPVRNGGPFSRQIMGQVWAGDSLGNAQIVATSTNTITLSGSSMLDRVFSFAHPSTQALCNSFSIGGGVPDASFWLAIGWRRTSGTFGGSSPRTVASVVPGWFTYSGGEITDADLKIKIEIDHYLIGTTSSSVANEEILWSGTTTYTTAWDDAIATWNVEDPIVISENQSTSTLEVVDVDEPGEAWTGQYTPPAGGNPGLIELNTDKLDGDTPDEKQNTAAHELGHALGLHHSYLGNIMYEIQTSQTALGYQDLSDYHYLWGN